ncbi:MAG: efflux RND transporter permease subunit [Succinivibrionaceae bacterium]|nr:efflux RND transporter permease subunit [Succinivibrionaceae bacterium]
MNTKLFIDRPILSSCISVLLVILGVVAIRVLPVEQYPDIAPPTVQVSATYTGASAETVLNSVLMPLEDSINGVEGMTYMTSTATNTGTGTITVYFAQGTNSDMAAVNVQNRAAKVSAVLPADVTKNGVTTEKQQNGQLKVITLYSEDPAYDEVFLANYMNINVVPQIKRITGVGGVMVLGSDYSMRVWLNPQKMSQYGLIPSDIAAVLAEQNLESATGTFGKDSGNVFLYTMKYRGRYKTVAEYGDLVIRSLSNGNLLRLKDVATIELGAQTYSYSNEVSGHPATTCLVMQSAGSNANEIITALNALEEEIANGLPQGVHIADLLNVKDFLDASIHEVVKTLFEAVFLVVLVVYAFLQSLRSTIIPLISILVSLIGTFAFILAAGFSINLLTLFALVLVIGTVVDDAIVVVEAVQARFDQGERSPYAATVSAMESIAAAIVSTSLVFMSVFIPVCFMGGTSGVFYTQFGVTMAVAVGISAVNALTLTPALCAVFMRPSPFIDPANRHGLAYRFHVAFDSMFARLTKRYLAVLARLFRRKSIIWGLLVVSCAGLAFLMAHTKTGLVPDEDTGTIFVAVSTSPGYTLEQTKKAMDEVEDLIGDIPEFELCTKVTGYNLVSGGASSSGGTFIIRLKNWELRPGAEHGKDAVIAEIFRRTANYKSASVFAFAPPMISGYGTSNGISMYVQDRHGGKILDLFNVVKDFNEGLMKRPEISSAFSTFDPRFPQFEVTVDAAKCMRMGVSPSDVLSSLAMYVGGSYVSDLNLFSKVYKVMLQAKVELRDDPSSLSSFFVRSSKGSMLPLEQFVIMRKVYGPEMLNRFNLFSSISVNVAAAEGYSSGDAIRAISEVAAQALPQGYGYEFGGITREEVGASSSTAMTYTMCAVFIMLILCSLYESLLIPLAVMLAIPSAMLGSFIFANLMDVENNIYMQTGLIMLIGLVAKTAILLTEHASEGRRSGLSISAASIGAAKARLRPILMTSICMVAGLMPLVVAHGVGANGNRSLGVTVVGGMTLGIVCLLVITPVCFVVLQAIQERFTRSDRLR